jgi:hypothetical protein
MLNLALCKPFSLVKKMLFLENPINMDTLLPSSLEQCVHYLIGGFLFHAVRVELRWFQLFYDI